MKLPILLSLAAVAVILPACTTVHNDPAPTTTTTETTETHVRSPLAPAAATTSTTVRSY